MGGKSLIDDALALTAKALEGRAAGEAASAAPGILQEGYRVQAHPTADLHTKNLVDYLNTSRSHLPMDQEERMARAGDMGFEYDAYHGAPRDIEGFDNRHSNSGGYWGGHHYATTSPVDASANYAHPLGADIAQRIGQEQEKLLDGFHPNDVKQWFKENYNRDLTDEEAVMSKNVDEWSNAIAHDVLGITNAGMVYPVKMRMQNPVRTDSPEQTVWAHDLKYDENGDLVDESGPAVDLINHTRDVLSEYDTDPREVEKVLSALWDEASAYGGITAKNYRDTVQDNLSYLADPMTGDMVSPGHAMSDVFQRMGHDGIIMNTDVFAPGPMRRGMAGTGGDTQHYIVFDPKNIRSRFGAFDPFKANSSRLSDADGGRVEKGGGGTLLKKALKAATEEAVPGIARRTPNEVFPELATRYPEMAPPVPAIDKRTGKEYLAKGLSPEALAVKTARDTIQKDIDAGNYQPHFDVKQRADVDPSNYPAEGQTLDVLPKKQETRAKYRAMAFDPDGLARLRSGYEEGLKQKDVAENWYFMKQLEDEFVKELGPEEGRKQFKERFGKSMALTTGGADPTSNLLMAYYGNYLKNKGLDIPAEAYNMPYPIGGRYASSNMGMFERNMNKELTPDNPKRFNFQNNFLGHKQPTIDEQMSKGFDPKLQMPEWYGPYEEAINTLAAEYKVDPRYFQEVTWAGLKSGTKGGYKGMPMIQHVNEAIERTSRLTGLPPEEVVRKGLVRAEMPLYGVAAPAAGAVAVGSMGEDDDAESAVRIAKSEAGSVFGKAVRALLGSSEREGLMRLTEPGSGYVPPRGKPGKVHLPDIGTVEAKPIPGVMDTAHDYMAKRGLPGGHEVEEFPTLDEGFAARVADAYARMQHSPHDPEVRRAYDAMAQETLDQLQAAKEAGIDFTAIRGADPYAKSPAIGYADIAERGKLSFFPTDAGFGSSIDFDPSQNPLLKRIGKVGDLDNATVNDAFRIVHDLYGHYGPGNPFFRAPGEERAYLLHRRMYSPEALPAMTSETRGQNSWLNYGPKGEKNRKALSDDTTFADQKTGVMEPWTYLERADGGEVSNALRIAREVGGGTPQVFMTDAQGRQYDAQGNVIAPENPAQAKSTAAAEDIPAARDNSHTAPTNYYSEVQPAIDRAMTPMEMPGDKDPRNPNLTTYEPDLVQTMKMATDIATRGQPKPEEDTRGPANWSKAREEAITNAYGDTPGAANQALVNNALASVVTYPVEALHDIPYELGRTGDWGAAAEELGANALFTAPGLAAAGAAVRPVLGAIKRFPRAVATATGLGAATMGSDEAQAGPARWFSKLFESASALPMEKMTGEQALAMLRRSVSPEELRWTGTDKLLSSTPRISKGELLDHISKNRLQLNEVRLGGERPKEINYLDQVDKDILDRYEPEFKAARENYNKALDYFHSVFGSEAEESAWKAVQTAKRAETKLQLAAMQEMKDRVGIYRPTKYESYSTPGGEGYRETLYTYGDPEPFKVVEDNGKFLIVDKNGDPQLAPDGRQRWYYDRGDANRAAKSLYRGSGSYTSSHWDDPNVLFHTRSQTLSYDPPGANKPYRVHNVDETQSDWGQEGRRLGFKDQEAMAKVARLRQETQQLQIDLKNEGIRLHNEHVERIAPYVDARTRYENELREKYRKGEISLGDMNRLAENYTTPEAELIGQHRAASYERLKPLQDKIAANEAEIERLGKTFGPISKAPYIGSTEGWTDRSIKQELDKALDSDADYFSWSPGEVHAKRYSLDRHIEGLAYDPRTGTLDYKPKGSSGYGWENIDEDISPDQLEQYIGKEAAEKLLSVPADENNIKMLNGLDLKVGGEGMRGYYDKVYLKRVQDVIKKATGEKPVIEEIEVQTANGPRKQLGVRLTDEMREKARFSDFARGGTVTDGQIRDTSPAVSRALALTSEF